MEIESFIDELIGRAGQEDSLEPTDTGYQLSTRNFQIKLRKSENGNFELAVESYDGQPLADAAQKTGRDGALDNLTAKLSLLYQRVNDAPRTRVAALDDVVRELRGSRGDR